jgi:hypothetical protein
LYKLWGGCTFISDAADWIDVFGQELRGELEDKDLLPIIVCAALPFVSNKLAKPGREAAEEASEFVTRSGRRASANSDDARRVAEQRERRRMRRERQSREGSEQKQSGEGSRNRDEANKGPGGKKPKEESKRNRERNRGIDEEHNRVTKGRGGRGVVDG